MARRLWVLGFIFVAASAVAVLAAETAKQTVWNFDSDKPGEMPKGWTAATGTWRVAVDESAPSKTNVFAMTAADAKEPYNVALADEPGIKDVDVAAKMRAVSGKKDQGGGPVWRAKDARNYYVVRWNPLEDNFRLYKVVDGKRTQLVSVDLKADAGWHTIRAVMQGDRIECYFDGKKQIEATDGALKDAGKVGLWTKADAVTHFDCVSAGEK